MEIATLANKLNKPAFIFGGAFLVFTGAYIASSKSMNVGLKGSTQKSIPQAGRVAIGLFILFVGLMIAYNGVKGSESAS